MPKTEFLQIRLTPEDRARLRRAAHSDFLEVSTWARRAILQALERWEAKHAVKPRAGSAHQASWMLEPKAARVAEPEPPQGKRRRNK